MNESSLIAQVTAIASSNQAAFNNDQGYESTQPNHSSMFMTFQSSEKQFKRKGNAASSSDKYLDSARINLVAN